MNEKQWILIEDKKESDDIRDRFLSLFHFKPDYDNKTQCPFVFPTKHVESYDISGTNKHFNPHDENGNYRTTEQINIMKAIFIECMGKDEFIYALDWYHSYFKYNPRMEEPYGYYMMYTTLPETRAFFPFFYPNGDYYFFISKDFTWGYLTHPWQQKVWIFGARLIELTNKCFADLGFKPCV